MISFLKKVFVVGVVVAALALMSMFLRAFNEEYGDVERPEGIPVPSNSRPILAPNDMDK